MASITAHEIAEAASDPLINAWSAISQCPSHKGKHRCLQHRQQLFMVPVIPPTEWQRLPLDPW